MRHWPEGELAGRSFSKGSATRLWSKICNDNRAGLRPGRVGKTPEPSSQVRRLPKTKTCSNPVLNLWGNMNSNTSNEERAIVIGASMAGLLAARVLADHYDEVIVLERDGLPSSIENRRGVPQGRHTHGLLAGGREALEKLFPGISQQCVAAGAISGDIIREGRWFMEGGAMLAFGAA
jgi:hypothetical protein